MTQSVVVGRTNESVVVGVKRNQQITAEERSTCCCGCTARRAPPVSRTHMRGRGCHYLLLVAATAHANVQELRQKLAAELQKRCAALRPDRPLAVLVQVNTSAEESKSGCAPEEAADLCVQLRESCPNLNLSGLMCIGKYSSAEGEASADFACLSQCRAAAAAKLGCEPGSLALSMGMSHDFEVALDAGATHVRVGSTIFGARAKKV